LTTRRMLLGLVALFTLVLAAAPAWAGTSPAGIVNDEAGTLSAEQLASMDQALTGLRYQYRVVILTQAFAGDKPADAQVQFEQMMDRFLTERQVPQEAVLITVAMKERLVGFWSWKDGAVNRQIREATGRDFSAYNDQMVNAFRGPAAAGNVAEGVLSAVRVIEGIVPAAAPSTGPSPSPSPAPYYPDPPRERTYYDPIPVRPAPEPINWAPAGWTLLGFGGIGAIVLWALQYRTYRRRRREALAVRDAFLGELLHLMEKEFPMARLYEGEETRTQVAAAAAAADAALKVEQEAEETRLKAERNARFGLLPGASRTLLQALEQYRQGQQAFATAQDAWEPVGFALRRWDEVSDAAGQNRSVASTGLTGEKIRTGWALGVLAGSIDEAAATLEQGRHSRDRDPVMAVRLVQSADTTFQSALADLAAIPAVTQRLADCQAARQHAVAEIDEARRTLGLRFVELSPDDSLAAALRHEEAAAAALPEGDVGRVRSELDALDAAEAQALQILERYREAMRQYPLKSAALSQELAGLPPEQVAAAATLGDLQARFDGEDWADVRMVADDMAVFAADGRSGLDEVTRLTSPAEQRYLRAVELLDGWLARREELRKACAVLAARPAELEELCRQAEASAAQMDGLLEEAADQTLREGLRLPAALASQLDVARGELGSVQALGRLRPVPAHRWARTAADGASLAAGLREQVADVARRAAMARYELARAQQAAMAAMAYEQYDRHGHAGALRGALGSAEMALAAGNYEMALAECGRAVSSCTGLEQAYHDHLRAVREAEEAERRRQNDSFHSSSGSGGSGSWGSSSGSSSNSSSSNSGTGGSGNW
jgi:uncharacterized membrane protein YgcG